MKVTSFQFVSVDILAQGWFALHSACVGGVAPTDLGAGYVKSLTQLIPGVLVPATRKGVFFRHGVQFRAKHTGSL